MDIKIKKACLALCGQVSSESELLELQTFIFEIMSDKRQELKPLRIIDELINGGALRLEKVDGKFVAYHSTMDQFISWLFANNYDDLAPSFISENIRTKNKSSYSVETIKKLMRQHHEIY